jgi:hypothetical protein
MSAGHWLYFVCGAFVGYVAACIRFSYLVNP